jgi:hypothetical protein
MTAQGGQDGWRLSGNARPRSRSIPFSRGLPLPSGPAGEIQCARPRAGPTDREPIMLVITSYQMRANWKAAQIKRAALPRGAVRVDHRVADSRISDLQNVYALLGSLAEKVDGSRTLSACSGGFGCPRVAPALQHRHQSRGGGALHTAPRKLDAKGVCTFCGDPTVRSACPLNRPGAEPSCGMGCAPRMRATARNFEIAARAYRRTP